MFRATAIQSGSSISFPHPLFVDMVEDNLLVVDIQVPHIKDEEFIVAVTFVIVFVLSVTNCK